MLGRQDLQEICNRFVAGLDAAVRLWTVWETHVFFDAVKSQEILKFLGFEELRSAVRAKTLGDSENLYDVQLEDVNGLFRRDGNLARDGKAET